MHEGGFAFCLSFVLISSNLIKRNFSMLYDMTFNNNNEWKLRSKTINSTNKMKKKKRNEKKNKTLIFVKCNWWNCCWGWKRKWIRWKMYFQLVALKQTGYITFFHKHTPNLILYIFVIVYDRTHTSQHCVISYIAHDRMIVCRIQ